MSEPKKVDRRKFIYAGLGAVALIAIGAAAYVVMNPPVVTQTTTVPTTSVVTTTVPTTSVVTTTSVATTTVPTTSVVTTTLRPKGQLTTILHKPPWLTGFQAIISGYQKANPDAKVNLELVANITDMRDKIVADAVNKTGLYDVYLLNGGQGAGVLVPGGYTCPIKTLDPLYKKDPNLVYFGFLFKGEEIAGLPLNANNDLLFYRKDLLDERGLKPPTTWDDVKEIAKTLHDPSKPIYGFVPRGADDPLYEWSHILVSYGGDYFVDWKHGDFSVRVNDEHGLAAAETFVELLNYAPPQPISITQSDMMSYMASGKGAQALIVFASTPWMDDPTYSVVPMKIDYAVPPKGTGLPGCDYGVIDIGCWGLGVSIYSKNKELAYDFMKYCVSYEAQLTFALQGVAPVRKDIYGLESLINNPKQRNLKAEGEALNYMKESPAFPEFTYIWNPMGKNFVQKLISERSPKDALNWFAESIYNYLKDKGYKTSWQPLK
jgi:multiple sugar transport system substrate-binding protein